MRGNWRWFAGLCVVAGCARGPVDLAELDGAALTGDPSPLDDDDDGGASAGTGGSNTGGGSNNTGLEGPGNTAGPDEQPEPDAGPELDEPPARCDEPVACETAKAAGMPNVGTIEWSKTELITTKLESGNRFYLVSVTGESASEVVNGGVEARLSSPAGSNYDLFMYGGADGFDHGLGTCEAPSDSDEASAAKSEALAGMPDTAYIAWSAGAFGALSDRIVTIEVRHIDGPCADFTLELYGAKK